MNKVCFKLCWKLIRNSPTSTAARLALLILTLSDLLLEGGIINFFTSPNFYEICFGIYVLSMIILNCFFSLFSVLFTVLFNTLVQAWEQRRPAGRRNLGLRVVPHDTRTEWWAVECWWPNVAIKLYCLRGNQEEPFNAIDWVLWRASTNLGGKDKLGLHGNTNPHEEDLNRRWYNLFDLKHACNESFFILTLRDA